MQLQYVSWGEGWGGLCILLLCFQRAEEPLTSYFRTQASVLKPGACIGSPPRPQRRPLGCPRLPHPSLHSFSSSMSRCLQRALTSPSPVKTLSPQLRPCLERLQSCLKVVTEECSMKGGQTGLTDRPDPVSACQQSH